MGQATQETERALSMMREELNSVTANLHRAAAQEDPTAAQRLARLKRSESDLLSAAENLHNKLQEYKTIKQRAQNIAVNADYAAKVAFDLCANMKELSHNGLFATQSPDGFLVRQDTVFVPKSTPVTEEEIYFPKKYADDDSWESAKFNVVRHTTGDTRVEGIALSRISRLKNVQRATPRFIVFSSRQLANGASLPVAVARSPYGTSGITSGQLAFYAGDAVRSGGSPQIGWSVLVRDLAAFGLGDRRSLAPSNLRWCQNDELSTGRCPDLAAEVQIRAPVPIIPDLPVGASVKNPVTSESVSLIPPMPVGMF
jgi:hypothetical protein